MMSTKAKVNLGSSILIAIMLISWVTNFGWLRLVMTFWLFPIVQPLLFFVGNMLSASHFAENKAARHMILWSFVTFLLPHLLIVDAGDGNGYIFFGLIEHKQTIAIANILGFVLLAIHAVVLFSQYANHFYLKSKNNRTRA